MNISTGCVWLVDDDEDDLILIQAAFRGAAPNLQIRTLLDGDELLPQLETMQSPPNLIVLDLNMNRTSGLEALKDIRLIGNYGQFPIVVLTTSTNPADQIQSEALGVSDYYIKPSTFQDLSQLAQQLIHQWLTTLPD